MMNPTQIRFSVSVWESSTRRGRWLWSVDFLGSPVGSGTADSEKAAHKATNDALDAVIHAANAAKVK